MAIGELIRNSDLLWDGIADHDIIFRTVDASGATADSGYDPYNATPGANFTADKWYPLAPISGESLNISFEKDEKDRLNADSQKFDRRDTVTSVMITGEMHYDLEYFFRKNKNTLFSVLLKSSKRRDGMIKFMFFPIVKFRSDNEMTPSSDLFNFEIMAEPAKTSVALTQADGASLSTEAWGASGKQIDSATIIPVNSSGSDITHCTVAAGDFYEEFMLDETYAP